MSVPLGREHDDEDLLSNLTTIRLSEGGAVAAGDNDYLPKREEAQVTISAGVCIESGTSGETAEK